MSTELADLKERLKQRLIETNGTLQTPQMAEFAVEGRELGLDERDLNLLLREVDGSINWNDIRAKREFAAQTQREVDLKTARRQEEIAHAPMLLDTLIALAFDNNSVSSSEIDSIFRRGDELEQSEFDIAKRIKERLDTKGFRPHPPANMQARTLREILESTNWYSAAALPAQAQQQQAKAKASEDYHYEEPAKKQVKTPPTIHYFRSSRENMTSGEKAELSWKVSGVEKFLITGLGESRVLEGSYMVAPEKTTVYTLTAGPQEYSIVLTVAAKSGGFLKWLGIIIGILVLMNILSRC